MRQDTLIWQGVWGPLKAPRSSWVNGAKSCYLGVSWAYISDIDHIGFMCHKSDKTFFFLEGGIWLLMCKMNKLEPLYLVNYKCGTVYKCAVMCIFMSYVDIIGDYGK